MKIRSLKTSLCFRVSVNRGRCGSSWSIYVQEEIMKGQRSSGRLLKFSKTKFSPLLMSMPIIHQRDTWVPILTKSLTGQLVTRICYLRMINYYQLNSKNDVF